MPHAGADGGPAASRALAGIKPGKPPNQNYYRQDYAWAHGAGSGNGSARADAPAT